MMQCAMIGMLVLAAGSAVAGDSPRVEVSADGQHTVRLGAVHEGFGVRSRGVGVPFPAVPDDVVELRRQVGGLQIADVNGDGFNDVVAVCYISNSFPPYEDWHDMVFYGTGSGLDTSAPGWVSDVETHTGDVQVGDLNGDGWTDMVTIHGGGLRRDSVRAYFGAPGGMPTAAGYTSNTAASSWGTAGVLADMDQDGDLDLVTTNQGLSPDPYRPMLMFDNTGSTLTTAAVWQSSEQSIQSGVDARDLTGDGYPDLVVAKWVNFQSGIYFNTTGVPDVNQSLFTGITDGDRGAVVGDLQGDGIMEVGFGGDPSRLYAYDGGALTEVYQSDPPFSGPQDLRLFDVDGDGDEDLAEIHFSDGRAHIYLNRSGLLDAQPTWTFDASEVGTAIAFGDLNGDGLADLVTGYSGNTCLRVFYAQRPRCVADWDQNGTIDIFDVFGFLNDYQDMDPGADLTDDGAFDIFDVFAYLDSFNEGCD